MTHENLIHPDDPRIIQLLATQYDCCEQFNLGKFGTTWTQKCTQAPSEIEDFRALASVFIRAKAGRTKAFGCSATIQKARVFCAQGVRDKQYRHGCMGW